MRTEMIESAGRITLFVGDDRAAQAAVSVDQAVVDVHFDKRGGHVLPGTRAELVDAVLALPQLRSANRLRASIPIGDAEIITQLTRRCPSMHTRAAGATCLVDADLSRRTS